MDQSIIVDRGDRWVSGFVYMSGQSDDIVFSVYTASMRRERLLKWLQLNTALGGNQ